MAATLCCCKRLSAWRCFLSFTLLCDQKVDVSPRLSCTAESGGPSSALATGTLVTRTIFHSYLRLLASCHESARLLRCRGLPHGDFPSSSGEGVWEVRLESSLPHGGQVQAPTWMWELFVIPSILNSGQAGACVLSPVASSAAPCSHAQ